DNSPEGSSGAGTTTGADGDPVRSGPAAGQVWGGLAVWLMARAVWGKAAALPVKAAAPRRVRRFQIIRVW
ncbi:MAG TPA: hypothetical protein VF633_10065, partial [Brevundimonas sp.]